MFIIALNLMFAEYIRKNGTGSQLMKRNYFNIIFLGLVLILCNLFSEKGIQIIKGMSQVKPEQVTIVLDAGHGGFDPGKIGVNEVLEKDINLSITYKLKGFLEQEGIKVILTREDDNGLYKPGDWDKKRVDMSKRVAIINSSDALFAVSIHQNSFSQESSRGAQVFYHQNSVQGKILAETIQERVKQTMNDGNHRLAKANGSYYMLRYTRCPLVIVECGFLSNWREAGLLSEDSYQEKIAQAIHLGIIDYINNLGIK